MNNEEGRGAPDPIDFEVLAREPVEVPDEPRTAKHRGPVRRAFDRALPGLLAVVLVGSAVALVRAIPPQPEPSEPPAQEIAERANLSTGQISALPPDTSASTPKRSGPQRRSQPKPRRVRARSVAFSLGGPTTGSPDMPAADPHSAPVQSHPNGDPDRSTKTKKRPPAEPPEATLSFRRLYKPKNGDHFHSVYASDIAAKAQAGYSVVEQIGYLFEERESGTHLLSIDEGVMGWLYDEDQGTRTRPLYRLKGPDYHDYEVIFTSSDAVKEEWVGNGWRLERIEGFIVVP